jgi:hypothetical protein
VTVEGSAGLAMLLSFRQATDLWAVRLLPGSPATFVEIAGGVELPAACTGEGAVGALVDESVSLVARRERLTVTVGDDDVLACELPTLSRGAAGIGLLGEGTLRVTSFDVRR